MAFHRFRYMPLTGDGSKVSFFSRIPRLERGERELTLAAPFIAGSGAVATMAPKTDRKACARVASRVAAHRSLRTRMKP